MQRAIAKTWLEQGQLRMKASELQDAERCFRRALRSTKNQAVTWFNLAVCLRLKDDADQAINAYRRAIEHDPGLAIAREQLGRLLYREGRADEAAEVYRLWHTLDPSHPIAAHMASATGTMPPPPRASDRFVRFVFDRAADEYDAALVRLGYEAPRLLHECAVETMSESSGPLDMLDLGCGTGLCGVLFRPMARRLVGVDLSPAMLQQARQRAVYEELQCEELGAYLGACVEKFDLVVAADVLCYFGELVDILARTSRVLRPGGLFLFSVEAMTEGDVSRGFALQEHGRYAHAAAYVQNGLRLAGLDLIQVRRAMLRFERGAPVDGLTVVAHAGGASTPRRTQPSLTNTD